MSITLADAEVAYVNWGANCGPTALAAVLGLTLDQVRPHMGDFERKGYTNPTLMYAALKSLGAKHHDRRLIAMKVEHARGARAEDWPRYGLCRVQWEGPWTAPGVPLRARYRHTHWIGCSVRSDGPADIGIFDVNCLNNGTGWVSLDNWRLLVVPEILAACEPKASGGWHLTHTIEIARPA